MLSKTKKIALLTTGLVGALVTSSAVGVALSSCSSTTTTTDENTKYNTYINWSDPNALANLVVDESGLVYSDIYKTTIIAVTPSFTSTTVTIPSSVTSITGYTEVLPSGETIVRGAFQPTASTTGTSVQSGVTLANTISTVKFAANSKLKSIGAKAFYGCTLLQSIDLPSSVTMIGANAFYGCTLLNSISLTNVEYVGEYAFYNVATNLASPSIKVSLNKAIVIGNNAFQNAKITGVDFSSNTSLISLGNYAFNGCTSLTGTVDLSKATSLLSTGTYTFQNCTGITAVNLPSSITTIGDYAFSGCTAIANTIDISGATKLSTIGTSAFQNCTSLTGLSYPTSAPITSFGSNAFSGCTALSQLGTVADTFTAPAALTNIASSAFAGTKIATVDISNMTTATPFSASALANMTSLSKVVFSSTITTLPANLFQGDTSLTDITLPKSITSVVTDSGSSTTTGEGYSAFYGSSLETIDMSAITSYVVSTTTSLTTTVPAYLFTGLTTLKNVVLKTGTTAIGNYAFQNTSGLVYVKEASQSTTSGYTTTGTLTTIGNYAFAGSGLSSFTATATTAVDGTAPGFVLNEGAFQDTTSLTTVDLSNATNLTTIPSFAFRNSTGLKTITLPEPTTSGSLTLGESAFYGVTNLTAIDFSKFSSLTINTSNFVNANALATIDLSGLTSIPTFISDSSITTFTGLPSTAVVKLSSAINAIANSTVFTQIKADSATTYTRVALEYPNGLTFTTSQVNSGTLTGVAGLLSSVTGDLNLTSNSTLQSLGTNTLFGNANITSLTLPLSSITSSTNLYTLATTVTAQTPATVNTKTDSQYTSANVPLGNNTKLTNINFTKTNSTAIVGPGSLDQSAFDAIAKIINSYAYYSSSSSDSARAASDSVNFKKWETTNNTWIESDATLTYTAGSESKGGTVALSGITAIDKTSSDTNTTTTTSLTLTYGTTAKYLLTHNNIKWNLVYDASAETLTLTTDSTTPANIYKGYVDTTTGSVQVYLKTTSNDGTTLDTSGAQVKISFNLINANPSTSTN